jgi:NADPH:quinone reductase-like Zn-dependent oxidoreductase
LFFGSLGNRKVKLLLYRPNRGLAELVRLFEAGGVKPVIDRVFPMDRTSDAFKYFGEGKAKGKIVIASGK